MRRLLGVIAVPVLMLGVCVFMAVTILGDATQTLWVWVLLTLLWVCNTALWLGLLRRALVLEYDEVGLWDVVVHVLRDWALGVTERRGPDQVIYAHGEPYLSRWWVFPWSRYPKIPEEERTLWQGFVNALRLPAIYIHVFTQSDDVRAAHDHPWPNCSVVLSGGYWEWRGQYPTQRVLRCTGDVVWRRARSAHRIEVITAGDGKIVPALTLFLTGFKTRSWGFWCPGQRWVPWREYTQPDNTGLIGKGCGEP